MKKEVEIQAEILNGLRKMHIGFFWRNNNTGVFDKEKMIYRKPPKDFAIKGASDILGCYQGRFVAIEVKTPESMIIIKKLWNKIAKEGGIYFYRPKTNFEHHIYNQILFITEITHYGGYGFFTSSFEHTLSKLGVSDDSNRKSEDFGNKTCKLEP